MKDNEESPAAKEVTSGLHPPSDLSAEEARQGDYLLDVRNLPILDSRGEVVLVPAPEGAIVITQCCDLARGGNGYAHLSPVVILPDDKAALARSGRTPRFVPIPELSPSHFVDLGTICSTENQTLRNATVIKKITDDQSRYRLGQLIGRRFSRFPFPGQLNPMLQQLRQAVRKKAGKPQSSFGQILDHLVTLRLEVEGGWSSPPPWQLTLLLVLEAGRLPTLPTTPSSSTKLSPTELESQDVTQIADAILQLEEGDPCSYDLWWILARAGSRRNEEKAVGGGRRYMCRSYRRKGADIRSVPAHREH